MAVSHAAAADPMGWAGLGIAVSDRSRPLRALCTQAAATTQEADRLGQADAAASRTLVARPPYRRSDRQQLCRNRTAQRRAPPGLDHPPASRCPTIRPTTPAPTWRDGAATRRRLAAAYSCQTSRQRQDTLAPLPSNRLVWTQRPSGRDRVQHCHLV